MFTHNTEEMTPLENKEIRGLSLRALAWLVGSTVTIVLFIVSSYFLLTSKIEAVDNKVNATQSQKLGDDKIIDLRLQVIQSDINRLNTALQALQNQVNGNSQKINGR
jgi:hypothetical protein